MLRRSPRAGAGARCLGSSGRGASAWRVKSSTVTAFAIRSHSACSQLSVQKRERDGQRLARLDYRRRSDAETPLKPRLPAYVRRRVLLTIESEAWPDP